MRKMVLGICFCVSATIGGLAQAASPYPPSELITGLQWDLQSHRSAAEGADIWPLTWANDSALVAAWGDAKVDCAEKVSYGVAAIATELPSTALDVRHCGPGPHRLGKMMAIVAAGDRLYTRVNKQDGSTGFPVWRSEDGGRSWSKPAAPLTFLIDSFVQFGRANAGAPGGLVYALENRTTGIFLLRAPADSVQVNSAYEYFSGTASAPSWSSRRSDARSIFSDPAGIVRPSITYVPGLGRYLLVAAHSLDEQVSNHKMGIFEAPEPWGPWRTVSYVDNFLGLRSGRFLGMNFPIRWQTDGGRTLWATFSCYERTGSGSCGIYHDQFNLMKVTLQVGGTAGGPKAVADSVTTDANTSATVAVLANDSGTDLTIPEVTVPANGSARINSDRTVTYTPVAGHTGSDRFDYTIRDGSGRSATATVSVTVRNRLPVAGDDSAVTTIGTAVAIQVLANDSDPDGHALSVTAVTNPPRGSATISTDKQRITYRPDAGASGNDSFTYTVGDGRGGTDQGVVAVAVRNATEPVPPIDVAAASYGATTTCNATTAVARLCNGLKTCSVAVGNDLCGDPQPYTAKTLSVSYVCGTQNRLAGGREGQTAFLGCGGLYVTTASYGTTAASCDARTKVGQPCDGRDACSVTANNTLCGDPEPGKLKTLKLTYTCQGAARSATIYESKSMALSCP